MKKKLLQGIGVLAAAALLGLVAFYILVYPRHYEAEEFPALDLIADASTILRLQGNRGALPQEQWPRVIVELSPDEVRVYPTGVLIRLRGFFSYESGLYIPAPNVAEKIDVQKLPVYRQLQNGVYSYKVEG